MPLMLPLILRQLIGARADATPRQHCREGAELLTTPIITRP